MKRKFKMERKPAKVRHEVMIRRDQKEWSKAVKRRYGMSESYLVESALDYFRDNVEL